MTHLRVAGLRLSEGNETAKFFIQDAGLSGRDSNGVPSIYRVFLLPPTLLHGKLRPPGHRVRAAVLRDTITGTLCM